VTPADEGVAPVAGRPGEGAGGARGRVRLRHEDGRPDLGRLVGIGLLGVLLAVVLNVVLARLAAALAGAPPGFLPLRGAGVVFLTLAATGLGVALFILLVLTTRRPGHWFRVAAYGVALLSCLSPISLMLSDPPRVQGATWPLVGALLPLHLAPAVVLAELLARRGWPEASSRGRLPRALHG
jgi:hypothetical protein